MKIRNLPAFIAAMALLAACSDPRPPEEIVAERAQARWDAMVERDFEQAWEYYTPGFREQTSSGVFAADFSRRPVRWEAADVVEVTCEEQRCESKAQVEYSAVGAPGQLAGMRNTRAVTGIWIKIDDQWWYAED